jgi:hypothetical protein
MYTLMRAMTFRAWSTQQLPTLLIAGVIAELFYKFHSFTLETGAFLATWWALDFALQGILHWRQRAQDGVLGVAEPKM